MASLPNSGLWASRSRRFFSTSLWTYSARIRVNALRRAWIKIARETLHGASTPSRNTPESKNNRGTEGGLLLSIQFLEVSPTHLLQVFQGLFGRDSLSSQNVLDALTELIQGQISWDHHQGFSKLEEKDFTSFRELMPLAVGSRNRDFSLFSYADCANRSGQRFRHQRDSFTMSIFLQRVTSPTLSRKAKVRRKDHS